MQFYGVDFPKPMCQRYDIIKLLSKYIITIADYSFMFPVVQKL